MTPAQHYAKAEEILDDWSKNDNPDPSSYMQWFESRDFWMSVAQVHATLAGVSADTALRAEVQP